MGKVKNDNHIIIHGWMINDLELSGVDLLVYAIIWGFSQDGESTFYGSRQYLADWCTCTTRTVQTSLNNLIDAGLIHQVEKEAGAVVKYKATRGVCKNFTGGCENISQGCEKIAHNNIDKRIEVKDTILKDSTAEPSVTEKPKRRIPSSLLDDVNDKGYESEEKREKKETKRLNLFQKCQLEVENFTTDEQLRAALLEYLTIRLKIKDKPMYGVGQWKGMLSTLDTLTGDKVAIVKKATERGWAGFFELKGDYYTQKKGKDNFAESTGVKSVDPKDVKGGNFSGQIF